MVTDEHRRLVLHARFPHLKETLGDGMCTERALRLSPPSLLRPRSAAQLPSARGSQGRCTSRSVGAS